MLWCAAGVGDLSTVTGVRRPATTARSFHFSGRRLARPTITFPPASVSFGLGRTSRDDVEAIISSSATRLGHCCPRLQRLTVKTRRLRPRSSPGWAHHAVTGRPASYFWQKHVETDHNLSRPIPAPVSGRRRTGELLLHPARRRRLRASPVPRVAACSSPGAPCRALASSAGLAFDAASSSLYASDHDVDPGLPSGGPARTGAEYSQTT